MMNKRVEGLVAGLVVLLLWLGIFLAGLSVISPSPSHIWWALIPSNPLLLYLWVCLYWIVTVALAVGVAWLMGQWLPLMRRGLLIWWEGWRQWRGRPRLQ